MSTMTLAEIDPTTGNRIAVAVDYRLRGLVKAVPGAKWDGEKRTWTVPLSWPACLALRSEFGADLEIGPNLKVWAAATGRAKHILRQLRNNPLAEVPRPASPGFDTLYPYQLNGALAIALTDGYIIADEQGTGKSRTALAGLELLADGRLPGQPDREPVPIFPCLIVAPKSMLKTWAKEIDLFFPGANVSVVDGTPKARAKALEPGSDFYVINYDLLAKHSRVSGHGSIELKPEHKLDKEIQLIAPQSVIADECHRAKNAKSVWTRALWSASSKARVRIGLTGTPIQDTPVDLWALLRFIAPMEYPSKTTFTNRYLAWGYNPWGGLEVTGLSPAHGDEFLQNLDARSRRITKDIALPFLPPKVHELRWVTLPPKLRKPYNAMEKELVADLGSSTLVAGSVLERAGRLVQLASAFGEMVDKEVINKTTGEPEIITRYRMTLPSPKIDAFLEDVSKGDFDGQSVVVYSDSRQLIDLLSNEMNRLKLDHSSIVGGMSAEDRQLAIDAFQTGAVKFCLITRAGGEGVTLTAASVMVRIARSWSLTAHQQAEDRVHRIGSEIHSSILILDYVVEDTVEEGQIVRLNAKSERAQEVLRDEEMLRIIKERTWREIEESA